MAYAVTYNYQDIELLQTNLIVSTLDKMINGLENTTRWYLQVIGFEKLAYHYTRPAVEFFFEAKYQMSFRFGWYIDRKWIGGLILRSAQLLDVGLYAVFHVCDLAGLYFLAYTRCSPFWIGLLVVCAVLHYLSHNFQYCSILRLILTGVLIWGLYKLWRELFSNDIKFDFTGTLGGEMFVHKPKSEIPPINPENPNLVSMTFKDTRTN